MFPETALTDAQLLDIVEDHRRSIGELLRAIREGRFGAPEEPGLRTAVDLADDTVALAQAATAADVDRSLRIAAANLTYAVLLAIIDLAKTHAGGPTVPRPRKGP